MLIAASLIIQLASLAFWLPLEIYQMETLGHPTFVIALRFKNIAAFALGKMDAWGLDTDAMHWDSWDYVHLTTWNFFPFLLRRVGAAPAWAVKIAFLVWGTALAALTSVRANPDGRAAGKSAFSVSAGSAWTEPAGAGWPFACACIAAAETCAALAAWSS